MIFIPAKIVLLPRKAFKNKHIINMNDLVLLNAEALEKECQWLYEVFRARISNHSREVNEATRLVYSKQPPQHENQEAELAKFIYTNNLCFEERLLLALALLPHTNPGLIDHLFHLSTTPAPAAIHSQLGTRGSNFMGYVPTGLTWLYLLAGNNVKERIRLLTLVSGEHLFRREAVLSIEPHYKGEPSLSGRIVISLEHLQLFTTGQPVPLLDVRPAIQSNLNKH